ncbi:MAG: cell division protein ZapA [Rhodospirillaceae bacterium]|nr:cell division protein ZapA [Rhodospirillaceae bacterium]
MAQVTLTIAGHQYHISCDDGQEAQIGRLGRYLDQRGSELTAAIGPIQENLLLAMVGLLIADELAETYGELEELRAATGSGGAETKGAAESVVVDAIEMLSARIETIAESVRGA